MLNKKEVKFFKEQAKLIRLSILDMIYAAQCAHIGSALSIVEILTVLFHGFLDVDLIRKKDKNRDIFILSKGHGVAALYATLSSVGLIEKYILKNYYKDGSLLAGHPIKDSFPGIEASTGSLGHGLSFGVGMAIAAKKDKINNKVYVLLGDGECQEGSVWEAVWLAVRSKLNNLVIIVDSNKLQALDRVQDVIIGSWKDKFEGFGCNTFVIDGHNSDQLESAFRLVGATEFPNVIVANTIKGKGISFMEDKLEWHYKSPNMEEYKLAKKEILKS